MSQFVKVPLLLLAGVSVRHGCTRPNPPAAQTEWAKSNIVEDCLRHPIASRLPHLSVEIILLAEVAAILCHLAAPQVGFLQFAGGDLNNIRSTPRIVLSLAIACYGGWLRGQCYRTLGRFFTYEMSIRKGHQLIKEGPYAVVRHPSYTAIAILFLGELMLVTSPGSWLMESGVLSTWVGILMFIVACASGVGVTAGLFNRAPREDEVMRKAFGAEWEQWAKNVPYRLVPYVY